MQNSDSGNNTNMENVTGWRASIPQFFI